MTFLDKIIKSDFLYEIHLAFFYVSLPLEHDYITNDMYFSLHHLITINTYDLFQLNLVTNYAK